VKAIRYFDLRLDTLESSGMEGPENVCLGSVLPTESLQCDRHVTFRGGGANEATTAHLVEGVVVDALMSSMQDYSIDSR